MKKYNYNDIKLEFEQRGYELISQEYVNCETPLQYICCKHKNEGIQDIDYSHFKRGQGCRFCGKENKKSGKQKELSEYNAKELTESKGMEFVKITREHSNLYVYYICPKHREQGIQKTSLTSIRRMKVGCPFCIGRGKTTESFKNELYVINTNLEVLGEYIDAKTPILCRCKLDNTKWKPTPNRLLCGEGCPECGRINSNTHSTKTHDEFLLELQEKNIHITPIEEYKQARLPIWFKCDTCGHRWMATPDKILTNHSCPSCTKIKSHNEEKIENILKNMGYNVIFQQRYLDCRDILPLPFDFYIPKLNLLIEYQGEQHYKPIRRGHMTQQEALEQLTITQKHDQIKKEYCNKNKIPLEYIYYWENSHLEEILNNIIQQYSIIDFTIQNDLLYN